MSERRGVFSECGQCGTKWRVVNAGLATEGPTCDTCKWWEDEDLYMANNVNDELVCTELGWCCCGNPERVDEMMLTYLESGAETGHPPLHVEGLSDDAWLLLAYLADDLGWTEHGGSVHGAWLTDEGRTAMANLKAARGDQQ